MKASFFYTLIITTLSISSCGSKTNSSEFLEQYSGNYLYTDNELVKVHSIDNKLLIDWRGAKNIEPLKTGDNEFFVKEMNAKIRFEVNPEDTKEYLVFVPKNNEDKIEYIHPKVANDFKTPQIFLEEGDYENALKGYLKIKEKDSLSPLIKRRELNRLGYKKLEQDKIAEAIEIFKINVALHPENDNVYDSLGDAYKKGKDTTNAILNYEKALAIDSGSRHTRRKLEDLRKKQEETAN